MPARIQTRSSRFSDFDREEKNSKATDEKTDLFVCFRNESAAIYLNLHTHLKLSFALEVCTFQKFAPDASACRAGREEKTFFLSTSRDKFFGLSCTIRLCGI